jgi:ABC-2 type transport system permease protein
MSTTVLRPVHARAGWLQALRSEWVKLRTVRSTYWSLLLLVGLSLLFSALACWESETQGGSLGQPGDNDIILNSLAGVFFGQIAAAVLAVLAITSEYTTRMIRTTFAANPRRRSVLAAKALVVTSVVLGVGLATSAACLLIGQRILQSNGFTAENGYSALSLADSDALWAVLGSAAYLGLLALFCVGVGAVLRHTAGAITVVLAIVLAPVIAIGFLPEGAAEAVEKASLMSAGLAIQQTVQRDDSIPLSQLGGLGVAAAYAVVAMVVAVWLIGRRDA